MLTAVILSAGDGRRMNSNKLPVLHELCGRPLLSYCVEAANAAGAERTVIVTRPDNGEILGLYPKAELAVQQQASGTAGALQAAMPIINNGDKLLVLFGNMPLLSVASLQRLILAAESGVAELVPAPPENEQPFSRGAFCLKAELLDAQELSGAAELCEVMEAAALRVGKVAVEAPEYELCSVFDRATFWEAHYLKRSFINAGHMKNGVTLLDPVNALIDADVTIGRDTVVYPGNMLLGHTSVGEGCTVFSSRLTDTRIGDRCVLQNVVANKATVGSDVTVGPFVNLRPDTVIEDGCKVGDFVEVKNSKIGKKTKLPHLSYIGDADVGERVNVGCGCVFVNYDGFKKHRTVVGNDVFLGCQTNLVAPVTVGNDVYTAAGSTITNDIPDGALAIARARQENKLGWVERIRAFKQSIQK